MLGRVSLVVIQDIIVFITIAIRRVHLTINVYGGFFLYRRVLSKNTFV